MQVYHSLGDFYYLSFPELSSDLHSVQVPSWVGAPVVMSNSDFLYDITDIFQLGQRQLSGHSVTAATLDSIRSRSTHLHNEHVLCSPLKVQTSLPFVDTQVFLLCAHSLLSIQDYEHIGICSRTKHITGVDLYLIWHN